MAVSPRSWICSSSCRMSADLPVPESPMMRKWLDSIARGTRTHAGAAERRGRLHEADPVCAEASVESRWRDELGPLQPAPLSTVARAADICGTATSRPYREHRQRRSTTPAAAARVSVCSR